MTWESEKRYATKGISGHGLTGRISWILGVIFAIVGVITEIIDTTFIIQSMSWYLLSIAAFVAGIPMLVTWAIAMHLIGIESKIKMSSSPLLS